MVECDLIIERALRMKYQTMQKYVKLENAKTKTEYVAEDLEEKDYSLVDAVVASLNLTENINLVLDYRMLGMSSPDIAKMLSRSQRAG